MSTYGLLADVEAARGQPVPQDQTHYVQELLDEAEVMLGVVAGRLADRVTAEATTAAFLKTAVVGMVLRSMRREDERRELASDPDTALSAYRAVSEGWLTVTRRERYLAGMPPAYSVSLAGSDESLAEPFVLPPIDHLRQWERWGVSQEQTP